MHGWGIPGSASWAHLSPPSIPQPSLRAPPSRILPVSELAGVPGSPAPLFMRRAYKRAVYNLAESPLLSASLPPRASGFLRFIPGFSWVSRGFGGGLLGLCMEPIPMGPGPVHLGFRGFWVLGGVFWCMGRKRAIGSGPLDQVFT